MFPERRAARGSRRWLVGLAALGLCACGGGASDPVSYDGGGPAPVTDAGPAGPAPSQKALVKFKGPDRLRNDLGRALELADGEICNELGRYSCTGFVHRVPLGGTAPYDLGLYQPLPQAALTGPLAVERVVMSACVARVDRDLGGDEVLFGGLALDAAGALVDVDGADVTTAVTRLYERALQRRPEDAELGHLRQLYRDVEAAGGARPARDWAVLACFAVMTSMEQLFY
ncbi:hypothetical protein [Haliangium sp.]|uniref:hypothetical protein n=1 Tax=Haliangium sp. TaxID=2663208 RepID=UPI003D0BB265